MPSRDHPLKHLIINADDFGLSHDVNAGIIKAWQEGAITDTTLLINGEAAGEAVHFALANPALGVGLHLNLDELLECVKGRADRFSPHRLNALLGNPDFLNRAGGVMVEQIRLFKATGLPLTHVDSHHHLHALPALFPLLVEKMLKESLKSVRIAPSYDLIKYPPILWDSDFYRKMKSLLKDEGIKSADHFAATMSAPMLDRGVTELMVHPGMGEAWREADLRNLLSPEWREALKKNNIRLLSFKDWA